MNFDLVLNSPSVLPNGCQHFYFTSDDKNISFYGERLHTEHRTNNDVNEFVSLYFLPDKNKYLWIINSTYGFSPTFLDGLEVIAPTKRSILNIFKSLNIPVGYYIDGVNHRNINSRRIVKYSFNYRAPIYTTQNKTFQLAETEFVNQTMIRKEVIVVKGQFQVYLLIKRFQDMGNIQLTQDDLRDEVISVSSWAKFLDVNATLNILKEESNLDRMSKLLS